MLDRSPGVCQCRWSWVIVIFLWINSMWENGVQMKGDCGRRSRINVPRLSDLRDQIRTSVNHHGQNLWLCLYVVLIQTDDLKSESIFRSSQKRPWAAGDWLYDDADLWASMRFWGSDGRYHHHLQSYKWNHQNITIYSRSHENTQKKSYSYNRISAVLILTDTDILNPYITHS